MKLFDQYAAVAKFEYLLESARMNATNQWEEEFVAKVSAKYNEFGGAMYWSQAQDQTLRKISGDGAY